MKRFASVFGLAARSSFWKCMAVVIAAAALVGVMLYMAPEHETVHYRDNEGKEQSYEAENSLWDLPGVSAAYVPMIIGFGGVCGLLAQTGWGKGAATGYTMRRLRVRKNTACLTWTVYNFMMIVIFWAMTALAAFLVIGLRAGNYSTPDSIGPQSVMLAFYSSAMLHHLVPGMDGLAWAGNVLGALACALGCADVAQKKWKGGTGGIALAFAVGLTMGEFYIQLSGNGNHILFIIGEALVIGLVCYSWWGGGENEEE